MDEGVVPGNRDVINNTHIAVLASSNLDFILRIGELLGVDDVKHFLFVV